MSEAIAHSPPDLASNRIVEDAWQRERRAFVGLLPTLLASHRGQFVAVHDGKVVASGADQVAVAREAYDRVGYVTVYLGHVDDLPRRPVRIGSPRLPRGEGSSSR
jgi:hypothetical protein